MITWMQKHKKYLIVTIWISTIAFVGAGFVGWGMYDFNLDRSKAVATVGDRSITIKEFQRSYQNLYSYYNNAMKGGLTKEKAKQLGLESATLKRLVEESLLLNYADELGLMATEEEVKGKLISNPNFKAKGVFNKDIYYKVLAANRLKPKEYEESLKKEIVLNKLKSLLKTPVTDLEIETLASAFYLSDKLEFKVIENKSSDSNISEDKLKAYWQKNKSKYKTTKSYSLESVDIFIKDMKVEEDELKKYYEKNRYQFKDRDGKIKKLEVARADVEREYRFKLAKNEAMKKHLKFKKGEITKVHNLVIFENDSVAKLDKLKKVKKGEYLKTLRLKNRYITAKLKSINFPEPMKYEAARELALKDYKRVVAYEGMKNLALNALNAKDFKGTTTKYLTGNDVKEIKGLNEFEASQLLQTVFSSKKKSGFRVFMESNKAVVYKIIDQKLLNLKKLQKNKKQISANIKRIKDYEINKNVISMLKKRYEIVTYLKGE